MRTGFFDFTSKFFDRKNKNEETEGMKIKKEILLKNIELTKKLERDLINQKYLEKQSKLSYQHSCPHLVLIPTKESNQTNSNSFNDYTAKCELCEAQLWNKTRLINYLTYLTDLINKYPKVQESIKIIGIDTEVDHNLFSELFELTKKLSDLKERIGSITDKEFSETFKERYKKN